MDYPKPCVPAFHKTGSAAFLWRGVRVIRNGSVPAAPFPDITDRALFSGEQGLLSVAFPPLFSDSHFYVYHTNFAGDNVVARRQVTADPTELKRAGKSRPLICQENLLESDLKKS